MIFKLFIRSLVDSFFESNKFLLNQVSFRSKFLKCYTYCSGVPERVWIHPIRILSALFSNVKFPFFAHYSVLKS